MSISLNLRKCPQLSADNPAVRYSDRTENRSSRCLESSRAVQQLRDFGNFLTPGAFRHHQRHCRLLGLLLRIFCQQQSSVAFRSPLLSGCHLNSSTPSFASEYLQMSC